MDEQERAAEMLKAMDLLNIDRGFGFMVYDRIGRYMTPGEVVSLHGFWFASRFNANNDTTL